MSTIDLPMHAWNPASPPVSTLRCNSRSWTSPTGEIVVLSPIGEVDLLTMPLLGAALTDVMDRSPRHVVIDLSGAYFCCARTFSVLAETARSATGRRTSLSVAGMSLHQDRIAQLIWADAGPRRYLSLAAAVVAIDDGRP